jgi:hypothetical protein
VAARFQDALSCRSKARGGASQKGGFRSFAATAANSEVAPIPDLPALFPRAFAVPPPMFRKSGPASVIPIADFSQLATQPPLHGTQIHVQYQKAVAFQVQ